MADPNSDDPMASLNEKAGDFIESARGGDGQKADTSNTAPGGEDTDAMEDRDDADHKGTDSEEAQEALATLADQYPNLSVAELEDIVQNAAAGSEGEIGEAEIKSAVETVAAVNSFREAVGSGTGNAETAEKADWVPYEGPQGGTGWKNPDTGQVTYDSDPPGEEIDMDQVEEEVGDVMMNEPEEELDAFIDSNDMDVPEDASKEDKVEAIIDQSGTNELVAQHVGAERTGALSDATGEPSDNEFANELRDAGVDAGGAEEIADRMQSLADDEGKVHRDHMQGALDSLGIDPDAQDQVMDSVFGDSDEAVVAEDDGNDDGDGDGTPSEDDMWDTFGDLSTEEVQDTMVSMGDHMDDEAKKDWIRGPASAMGFTTADEMIDAYGDIDDAFAEAVQADPGRGEVLPDHIIDEINRSDDPSAAFEAATTGDGDDDGDQDRADEVMATAEEAIDTMEEELGGNTFALGESIGLEGDLKDDPSEISANMNPDAREAAAEGDFARAAVEAGGTPTSTLTWHQLDTMPDEQAEQIAEVVDPRGPQDDLTEVASNITPDQAETLATEGPEGFLEEYGDGGDGDSSGGGLPEGVPDPDEVSMGFDEASNALSMELGVDAEGAMFNEVAQRLEESGLVPNATDWQTDPSLIQEINQNANNVGWEDAYREAAQEHADEKAEDPTEKARDFIEGQRSTQKSDRLTADEVRERFREKLESDEE